MLFIYNEIKQLKKRLYFYGLEYEIYVKTYDKKIEFQIHKQTQGVSLSLAYIKEIP